LKVRPDSPHNLALKAALQHASGGKCLLCGGRPRWCGLWWPAPHLQSRLGCPPGKFRTVAYALCKKCAKHPDAQRRVERRILSDVAVLAGDPASN
jgi:hypothetical protein